MTPWADGAAYSSSRAPAIVLTIEQHRIANEVQNGSPLCGGTYEDELDVAADALLEAGLPEDQVEIAVNAANEYFRSIGVKLDTTAVVPGSRRSCG